MKIPKGMEEVVFSSAYYRVKEFNVVCAFLSKWQESDLFAIEEINEKKQYLRGVFTRRYPKDHWNPLSKMPGAFQILGDAEIKDSMLKISLKTKSDLATVRKVFEDFIGKAIEFQREEFKNWRDALKE